MPEDIDLGNGLMLRQLPEGSYTYPKTIPTEGTDSDPFAIAAARIRQGVKGRQQLPVDEPTPYKAPNYLMEPDLLEAQQGAQLPTGIAVNDAGIPFNKATGAELPTVKRPNVLPIARTPDGLTLAMPKAMDIFGNMLGGVAGAPVKGAEVLLGSGPVRKVPETVYPLAKPAERWTNTTGQNDHLLQTMTPDEFLNKGRPLKIDAESRETIDGLKQHIEQGKPLDPLELHTNGKEDGRHRAIAAKELGIKEVPVLNFRKPEPTGPFFSALEKAVDTAKVGKADAQQWLGYLKNQPGVKSEELSYVLKDLPEGPISKEQLGEIIKGNKVELKEVVKGELPDSEILKQSKIKQEDWDKMTQSQKDVIRTGFPTNPTKYHSYQLPGGPLSRDTEILTRTGWKRIDGVSIGEEIITRKDENGELEWQAIQAVPTVYAEKLYHFYNQSIDMQVTANHKMVVRKRRRSSRGIFRITAEQLWKTSECVIPLTGNWTGKGNKALFGYDACDVAEFIGWYLAEGSYKHKNGIKNTIQIAQSRAHNPDNCDRLEALFDRLGVAWKYYGNGYGIGSRSINKSLLDILHNQPTSEGKFIPHLFFNENKHVVNSLLAGLILGDGHYSEEGYDDYGGFRQARKIFFSKSKLLADGVQILALLSGYRASVRKRPTGIYVVGINSKEWNSVDDAKYAIVDYHDFAFCVTVENHCIYVRRNGVAAFTGNSDYKEMLLTLPEDKIYGNHAAWLHTDYGQQLFKKYGSGIRNKATTEEIKKLDYYDESSLKKNPNFKSSHWDEPNIIAHIRHNDRMVDGKKTLHLEEIQSDWHQKGRNEGYKLSDKQRKDLDAIEGKLTSKLTEAEIGNPDIDNVLKVAVEKKVISADEARNYKDYVKGENSTVPDAPFKKNWDELALKRMLHKAANEGYEGISWTPGEAQAARYDLSKQVDHIEYNPKTKSLAAYDKAGNTVIHKPDVAEKDLAEHIGKEAANKIITNPSSKKGDYLKLENADLKIGGEGMKSFYDKMLVDKANALGKKYGSKVEQRTIDGKWNKNKEQYGWEKDGDYYFVTTSNGDRLPTRYTTRQEASAEMSRLMKENSIDKIPIHYLPITPELRAKAKQGFPLFSSVPITVPVQGNPFETVKDVEKTLTPSEMSIVNYHRDTIKNNKVGKDKEGNPVTVYSTTIEIPGGKFVTVPGYFGGKINTDEDKIYEHWKNEIDTGKWPIYNNSKEADDRAKYIHKIMDMEEDDARNKKQYKLTPVPHNPFE